MIAEPGFLGESMNVTSINTGLSGIQKGFEGINKAAQEIVSARNFNNRPGRDKNVGTTSVVEDSRPSLTESLIDLKTNVQLVESSGKVVQASDNALGTLLDILV